MNTIMNHEFVHVIAMDQAARRDRILPIDLFGGKVTPIADAARVGACTSISRRRAWRRRAGITKASRCFIDTWMAGGIGRAQGGYDEMVFRSMVQATTRASTIRSGWPSEGTKIDFQVEVNSYLYGTRFMTWLAYHYSPEQVIQWVSRKDGSACVLRERSSSRCSARRSSPAWQAWIGVRADVSAGEPRRDPQVPGHDHDRSLPACARLGVARVLRRVGQQDLRGLQLLRASSRTSARSTSRRAPRRTSSTSKVRSSIRSRRSRGIRRRSCLLHDRQRRAPRSRVARSGHRPATRFCRKTRASAISCSIAPTARSGASGSLNGLCTLVEISPPYTSWKQIATLPLRHDRVRPRRLAGRHDARGVVRRNQRQAGRARAVDVGSARGDASRRSRRSTSTAACRTTSSSRRTANISTAARTTRARRTSSATRSRRRRSSA